MATLNGSSTVPSFLPASAFNATARDVTFSNSYPTGGETITLAQIGLAVVYFAHANMKTPAGSVTSVRFDPSTNKIQAFTAAGEVANATNLSGLVVEVVFFGRP